jgi:hypothetical protein
MNNNVRIFLFFLMAVALYTISVRLVQSTKCDSLTLIGAGSAYVFALYLLASLLNPDVESYEPDKESKDGKEENEEKEDKNCAKNTAFSISPGAMCKGTSYLYTGDGPFSKMCQSLDDCDKAPYNCPNGFDGIPKSFPTYSSHSDSLWNPIPCNGDVPVKIDKLPMNCGEGCSQ